MYSDYDVVTGNHLGEFKKQVAQKIADGWHPVGGLTIYPPGPNVAGDEMNFYQAIALYTDSGFDLDSSLDAMAGQLDEIKDAIEAAGKKKL